MDCTNSFMYIRNLSTSKIGLLVGLATTFTVYGTGSSFGIYEGFWGLAANVATIIILNPFFAAKAKQQTNPVTEYLFNSSKSVNTTTKKGA